jgi:hypothetical protein
MRFTGAGTGSAGGTLAAGRRAGLLDSDEVSFAVPTASLVCGCSNPLFGGFPSERDLDVAFAATELDVGEPRAQTRFPERGTR